MSLIFHKPSHKRTTQIHWWAKQTFACSYGRNYKVFFTTWSPCRCHSIKCRWSPCSWENPWWKNHDMWCFIKPQGHENDKLHVNHTLLRSLFHHTFNIFFKRIISRVVLFLATNRNTTLSFFSKFCEVIADSLFAVFCWWCDVLFFPALLWSDRLLWTCCHQV